MTTVPRRNSRPVSDRVQLARPWVGDEEADAAGLVVRGGWYGPGPLVASFEEAIAALVGGAHGVGVSSGTAALQVALTAAGIGAGHEVVVPSLTFCATVQAITAAGATPVFADVDPTTLCLGVDDVEARLTPRTRAIVPVHFGGHAHDGPALRDLAAAVGVVVVEDAAHALGSSHADGSPVGAGPSLTCFSFDPIKAITCGQGGMVVTDDPAIAERARSLADLGLRAGVRQVVDGPGYRLRLGELGAAVGLAQLARWDEIVERRHTLWRRYAAGVEVLAASGAPVVALGHDAARMVPFFFVVRVPTGQRDALAAHLDAAGIDSAVHYPPNHLQPGFRQWRTPLPITERVATEILTLPFHTGMRGDEVDRVLAALGSGLR